MQGDGKFVVAGYGYNPGTGNYDFALARFNTDGSLDSSFGTGGLVTTDFGTGDAQAQSIAIQPNGQLVVAGFAFTGSSDEFAVARYNTDGTLDSSFGTDGVVTTGFAGSDAMAYAVALAPGGDIIVGGTTTMSATGTDFALAAYTSSGTLDPSFGTGGLVTTEFFGIDDELRSLAVQTNGQILAGGFANDGTGYEFALTCYNTDGSVDASFNPTTSGLVTTNFYGGDDLAYAITIQSNDTIAVAGAVDDGSGNVDFGVARYDGFAPLTDTTPANSTVDAIEGNTFSNQVLMTFSDINPSALASDFSVVVSYTNNPSFLTGPTYTVQLVNQTATESDWEILASGTIAEEGAYAATVQVSDADGNTVSGGDTTINVADAALTDTTPANAVTEEQGVAFSGVVVATFSDANSFAPASDYSARRS